MATRQNVLELLYTRAGDAWTFSNSDGTGENYDDLVWTGANAKPTAAELDSRKAEADAAIADRNQKIARERLFLADNVDALLRAFNILTDTCAELYRVLPAASRNAFDPTVLNRAQTLKNRIDQILSS